MTVSYTPDGKLDRSIDARISGINHWLDLCDEIDRLNLLLRDREQELQAVKLAFQAAAPEASKEWCQ